MAAVGPIYKVTVNNPNSDATAEVSGLINFVAIGPRNTGQGKLSGMPVPFTNSQTGREVENNTGSISVSGSPSSAAEFEVLGDEVLSLLKTAVENKYGVSLDLIKEEDVPEEEPEAEEADKKEETQEEVAEEPTAEEPVYVFNPPTTDNTAPATPPGPTNTKNRIYQVFEHTIELDELSLPGGEEKTEASKSQASLEYPLVKINDYFVNGNEINTLTIDSTGFLPKIALKCTFIHKRFITREMPKDGDIISIAIRNKSDSLKIIRNDYVITSVVSGNNTTAVAGPTTLSFFGKLFIPFGDTEKINLSNEGTSFETIKKIAKGIGLGFATNESNTDDKQIWLSGYARTNEFIVNTVDRAWKDETSFYDAWIDIYYNLNFVNINKQLMSGEDEVDIGVWINNIDKDFTYGENTSQDDTKVTAKVLSNYDGYKASSYYIKSWKPINRSTKITHEFGARVNCNIFEHNKNIYDDAEAQKYWSFGIDPAYDPEKVDKYILLRGRASQRPGMQGSDLALANYNYSEIYETNPWMGIQYTISNPDETPDKWDGNHHKNYLRARVHNVLNRKELDKLNIEVNVTGLNMNLIRGDKTPMVLIQTDKVENKITNTEVSNDDLLDQFYSGWFLVKGFIIQYDHVNDESVLSNFTQKFVLTRREWPPPIAVNAVESENEN